MVGTSSGQAAGASQPLGSVFSQLEEGQAVPENGFLLNCYI